MRRASLSFMCAAAFVAAACQQPAAPAATDPKTAGAAAAPKLGIRPDGDTEIKPDMSQVPPELAKVYEHIDENIDAARRQPAEVDSAAQHLELR